MIFLFAYWLPGWEQQPNNHRKRRYGDTNTFSTTWRRAAVNRSSAAATKSLFISRRVKPLAPSSIPVRPTHGVDYIDDDMNDDNESTSLSACCRLFQVFHSSHLMPFDCGSIDQDLLALSVSQSYNDNCSSPSLDTDRHRDAANFSMIKGDISLPENGSSFQDVHVVVWPNWNFFFTDFFYLIFSLTFLWCWCRVCAVWWRASQAMVRIISLWLCVTVPWHSALTWAVANWTSRSDRRESASTTTNGIESTFTVKRKR